jgi:hypothetical protein
MRITKRSILFFAATALFAVMLTGIAFAGNSGNGCKLQGVWIMGQASDWYLTTFTFQGTGDNEGTFVEEIINDAGYVWPMWFPGLFSNTHYTVYRGIWAKTGPNTYKSKSQGYIVQRTETGNGHMDQVALSLLDSGKITLTDCNTAEIEVETNFFKPGETVPFSTFAGAAPAKRLLLDQEYPFPK